MTNTNNNNMIRSKEDMLSYYSYCGVKLMNEIEDLTGKMFHETHPVLERAYYEALDNKEMERLAFLNNELCKEIDILYSK